MYKIFSELMEEKGFPLPAPKEKPCSLKGYRVFSYSRNGLTGVKKEQNVH